SPPRRGDAVDVEFAGRHAAQPAHRGEDRTPDRRPDPGRSWRGVGRALPPRVGAQCATVAAGAADAGATVTQLRALAPKLLELVELADLHRARGADFTCRRRRIRLPGARTRVMFSRGQRASVGWSSCLRRSLSS